MATRLSLKPKNRAEWDRLAAEISAMRARSLDATPAWEALIEWFAQQNREQFKSRGQRYHTPWAPLRPETIAEKRALGFPLDPLIRTRTVYRSLTQRPLDVEHMTPRSMTAGTNVSYARYHQTGTRRGLPARPLISARQIRREQAATSAVANWILRGEKKVGGRTVMRGGR